MTLSTGLRLVALALVGVLLSFNSAGALGLGLAQKTITVCPEGPPNCDFQRIQDAINAASAGDTIQVQAGAYTENVEIRKSLNLQGAGPGRPLISGAKEGYPVILVSGKYEIEVMISNFLIVDAKGEKCAVANPPFWICPDGLYVTGWAKVTIQNSRVSGNGEDGIFVRDSAQVSVENSTISGNDFSGLDVWESAQVILKNSTVSGNMLHGLYVRDSARASLQDSQISDNKFIGLEVEASAEASLENTTVSGNWVEGLSAWGSARVYLTNSIVSGNRIHGLHVWSEAQAEIQRSTIESNSTNPDCTKAEVDWICNGIRVSSKSRTIIIDSSIRNNTDWGVAAELQECGYSEDSFTGQLIFQGNNVIESNNTSGNQNGMGNPGNHPWNRPDVPDGQVCLP